MQILKKYIQDFLLSNLDDVDLSGSASGDVLYKGTNGKWQNAPLSSFPLTIKKTLSQDLFVPSGCLVVVSELDMNGFSIDIEGELLVV